MSSETCGGQVRFELSQFAPGAGVREYHLLLHPAVTDTLFDVQLERLLEGYARVVAERLPGAVPVFMRFFLSDAANQADRLRARLSHACPCAVSVVEQAPLDGAKVTLWVYLQTEVRVEALPSGVYEVRHGAYTHYWTGSACTPQGDSEAQCRQLLTHYCTQLSALGCRLKDHCIRTWFFVQNVDVNYAGIVKARNEVFAHEGLTPHTHFISSTGINGRQADPRVLVQLDAYAVRGLDEAQIQFLYAPSHLNPTYEYGVSFERGTAVHYGDRRQVYISGTASIDRWGQVLHLGDIRKQTLRMWENVDALLREADCSGTDICLLIVYLRDVTDYEVVRALFEERFPQVPKVIVSAPVCRPGWLIEMECIAVQRVACGQWPVF